MDFSDLQKQFIKHDLGITKEYGRIFTFVDFGNVTRWFKDDRQNDRKRLADDEFLGIDLEKLSEFLE